MAKADLKVVGQQDGYILTREEYEAFCEGFYEAQSLVRTLRGISHPDSKEEENISDLDIWNLSGVVLEKMRHIEPILGK